MVHGLAGNETEARRSAEAVLRSDRVNEARLGLLYITIGENSKALDLFETAFDEKSVHLLFAAVDPISKKIENDPGFRNLIERLGYPE